MADLNPNDQDRAIRKAAFEYLDSLARRQDHLSSDDLKAGFQFQGERIPLVNPQRGIFKPQGLRYLLSIRTVFPRRGAKVWYDDQRSVHQQIYESQETVDYAFMGTNADSADNRWLREAMEAGRQIIYFVGVSPGRYIHFRARITAWDAKALKAKVSFIEGVAHEASTADPVVERRYALRSVKQRLHQASFRDAVISAYGGRCALSGLPEQRLIDAAHIISDGHERLGQPEVPNGIPLSKIHHAAFDAHLIGIDPDYRLHIADQLLEQHDGPILDALKGLHGKSIHLPARQRDYPDRERLAVRFREYELAN